MQSVRALSTLAPGYLSWHQCQQSWTQRTDSTLARLPSFFLCLFLLLCFSRLAQENISLGVVLARALSSGANGVVYMKCRGRTDWRPWGGGAATSAREGCSHIGWRRGFARRIITSLTSLGLVVGMNNIAIAEFSPHVALQRRGSRLCRWLLWNSAVSGGRTETDVGIGAFRWKEEKGVATQETSETNTLFSAKIFLSTHVYASAWLCAHYTIWVVCFSITWLTNYLE